MFVKCIGLVAVGHRSDSVAVTLGQVAGRFLHRHQNRSTIMTSNRPIEDFGNLLGDLPAKLAEIKRQR